MPNKFANWRLTSVLPTPVGPANINEPIGLSSGFKPARDNLMASAKFLMASSWPNTRCFRLLSRFCSTDLSSVETDFGGMRAIFEIMYSICGTSITTSPSCCAASITLLSASLNIASGSTTPSAAWLTSKSSTSASSSTTGWFDSLSFATASVDWLLFTLDSTWFSACFCRRTNAPASSITSMALSGKKRSWMCFTARFTALCSAWSV